ncbi:MAG: ABC transporter permease [Gemmatimonadaceae bacterium]|nr:ABC transporter permease [Gemmatimonadaceae bacterium]MCW5826830.1 ABC transporter permease [Gemmatimonadaceae bacterium]
MRLDLRYVLRSLANARGFAIAVILTLGLGIGANTAIFSVVRGVLLKPLPHRDGDQLVYLRHTIAATGDAIAFSVPEINDFRRDASTLGQIAEYSPLTLNFVDEDRASQIDVGLVTGNYLSVMGLAPVMGRPFNADDDGAGAAPVVMLTHQYWQTYFGGAGDVVGRTLRIGGRNVEVIGVLQSAPFFPGRFDALMNMSISEHHVSALMQDGRTHRMTEVIARLSPDATVDQARQEVVLVTSRAHEQFPEMYDKASGYSVSVTPFKEVLAADARLTLILLLGVAAFVLIIACANVANLALMRGVRREHELTLRAALGAGSERIRRLLIAENLVLALGGAALGIAIAYAGVGMLSAIAARVSPRADEIAVDGWVLLFTLGLAVLVALFLSFVPSIGDENALAQGLQAGTAKSSGGRRRRRLQQVLVVTQVAVSVILLTGTGLLVRSMQRLAAVDPGLDTHNVLTMEVPFDFTADDPVITRQRHAQMVTELDALPQVEVVGMGSTTPLRRAGFQLELKVEGRPQNPGEPIPTAEYRTADPTYFRAAGIRIIEGRALQSTDAAQSEKVVVINQTLATRLWPDQSAVGRRLAWTGDVLRFIGMAENEFRTVVGVVADTKDGGLDAAPIGAVFLPTEQSIFPAGTIVLRANVDPTALAPAAREIVRSIAPAQPIENVLPLDAIRDESIGPRRLNALLVGSFGILALVIATIGIAAVLAFSVQARTTEIGIRISLGAEPGRIQRMILGEGGALLGIGLALGVAGSLALARLIQGLLFAVPPHDPATMLSVALAVTLVGLGACWLPALRASRIDPGEALRAG